MLHTKEQFSDFVARVEFKLPPAGNNGLAIRYPGTGDAAYNGMTELQVLDDTSERYVGKIDPRQAHGSAYGMVAAARGYQRPIGEWNYEEVTVNPRWCGMLKASIVFLGVIGICASGCAPPQ